MTAGCIIQARMGSTRLPGKILMKLDKQNTVLDYVIQQLKHCKNIEKIIVATTSLKEDDLIEQITKNNNVECFRGNELDVLDRYYQCAKLYSLSTVIRITADNPLIDPFIVDDVVKKFSSNTCDCMSNALVRSFPYGTETEIFSFSALEKAWNSAKKDSEREHVTQYFYANPEIFCICQIQSSQDFSSLRWTIDQMEDFVLVKNIVSKISKRPILMHDVIDLLTKEPELLAINKNVIHRNLNNFNN